MSSNDVDADGETTGSIDTTAVGPTIDLADVTLPADVADGLQSLYGTDEPIRDAEAWIATMRTVLETVREREPTTADLCAAADGDHAFEASDGDESQRYVCVLDPIAYAFIEDEPGTIRSRTQVRDGTVTIEVTEADVEASHPEAVISIGVASDAGHVEEVSPEVVYRQVCGYIHVFVDEDEYETWAGDVDAATTSVPVEQGIGLAKEIANALFE